MGERIEIISSDSPHLGKACLACNKPIQAQAEMVKCPRCHTLHHADCWKQRGGCAKTGCSQVAKNVVGDRPIGDGPPPPIPRSHIIGGIGIVILLILAMVFWPKPPDPAMGRTKVVFMTETFLDEQQILDTIVKQWNETSETIYIDLQTLPVGGMEQKLVVLMAAGDAPDIFTLADNRYDVFLQQEALFPMTTEDGETTYGIQHPARLGKLVVYSGTKHPAETLEVLDYLLASIPPIDLEELKNRPDPSMAMPSFMGF